MNKTLIASTNSDRIQLIIIITAEFLSDASSSRKTAEPMSQSRFRAVQATMYRTTNGSRSAAGLSVSEARGDEAHANSFPPSTEADGSVLGRLESLELLKRLNS